MGDHRGALESFERALPLFANEKSHELVNLWNEIGITQKNLGKYADARRTYLRGLDAAREIGDTRTMGFLLLNLAVLHGTVGEEERSVEAGQQALATFRSIGDRRGESIVLQNLANSYWTLGNRSRALDVMRDALAVMRAMGTRNLEGVVLKDLGDMYATLDDVGAAREQYESALQLVRAIGERRSIASTLIAMADLMTRSGRPDEAVGLADEGLRLAEEMARPELEWTARRSIASAAAAAGDTARAVDQLQASARIINDLRANVLGDMSKVAFVDTRQAVFDDLAALLIANGRTEDALEAAEAGRARAFADLLQQRLIVGKPRDRDALATVRRAEDDFEKAAASIRRAAGPADPPRTAGIRGGAALLDTVSALDAEHHELASLLTAQSPTIQDIRDTTRRTHATLIEYLVTDRQLLAWVVSPNGGVHSASVDVSRSHLESLVTAARTAIDGSIGKTPFRRQASITASMREFDRLLIAPIERWLPTSAAEPVIVVPHGPLALLPFAAIEDDAGRPLIERHVLAFAPAASVFAYTRSKLTNAARDGRALVIADPTPPGESGLGRLPWAREEGRLVAARLRNRGVQLLLGDDASEARVKREAGSYSILHFATHGLVAPERPLASSLMLRDGDGEDGYLRVDEIFNLDLSADLIVLSGCSTGLGKLTGDGIVGLTRAFLYAGTPTVVVSQWNVSDRATSKLMDRFYADLRGGSSKAQALRTAALAVRRQFANPAFWAAFELIGEP